jgi:hypothetical protein
MMCYSPTTEEYSTKERVPRLWPRGRRGVADVAMVDAKTCVGS